MDILVHSFIFLHYFFLVFASVCIFSPSLMCQSSLFSLVGHQVNDSLSSPLASHSIIKDAPMHHFEMHRDVNRIKH